MLEVLALQSPVAADLRLVSAILHSCLHLERIGDQAVNVAKMYLATTDLPGSGPMRQQIDEMGDARGRDDPDGDGGVRQARPGALPAAARRWTIRSTGSTARTHLEALKLADDPKALDWGMHMNMAARALERVGDNAVDIAEQVGIPAHGRVPRVHRRLASTIVD